MSTATMEAPEISPQTQTDGDDGNNLPPNDVLLGDGDFDHEPPHYDAHPAPVGAKGQEVMYLRSGMAVANVLGMRRRRNGIAFNTGVMAVHHPTPPILIGEQRSSAELSVPQAVVG